MRTKHELANLEVQTDLFLTLLHLIDYFVTNQLEYALYHVSATVAYVCNRLETTRDEPFVDNL